MIKILIYNAGAVREGTLQDVERVDINSWVDIENPSEQELEIAAGMAKIEPSELYDNLGITQGAIIKNFEQYSLLVFRSAVRGQLEIFTSPL